MASGRVRPSEKETFAVDFGIGQTAYAYYVHKPALHAARLPRAAREDTDESIDQPASSGRYRATPQTMCPDPEIAFRGASGPAQAGLPLRMDASPTFNYLRVDADIRREQVSWC